MKVKLFSHNDLDGVGAVVVGKRAFGGSLTFECCAYEDINTKVKEFILSPEFDETDVIFITDISVNDPEVIQLIEEKAKDKLMLLDHHGTAEGLNQYNWAKVSEWETIDGVGERLSSGTTAFYFYLVFNELLEESHELRDFVEQVRSYDCWDWNNKTPKNMTAKNLNDLHTLIGRWKFIERFTKNPEVLFTPSERLLLDTENKKIEQYLYKKEQQMVTTTLQIEGVDYNIGFVTVESYHSEVGNVLSEKHPELDFVLMVDLNRKTFSYRGIRDDLDLGKVAKVFGGGGHPKASGSPAHLHVVTRMIELMFSK